MCRYTDDGDFIHTGLCALYAAELADLVHRRLCEVHIEALETKGRLLRNGIQCETCLERNETWKCSRLLHIFRNRATELTLLDIDERELCIRREGHLGLRLGRIVLRDIRTGTGLLVCTHDETYALLQFDTGLLQCTHRIQCAEKRSLIVGGATAIDTAILHDRLKRLRHRPALACRYDIGMCKDVERSRKCSIEICCTHITIIALNREAVLRGQLDTEVQCIEGTVTVWLSFLICTLYRIDRAEIDQILRILIDVLFDPLIYLLIHNSLSFQL